MGAMSFGTSEWQPWVISTSLLHPYDIPSPLTQARRGRGFTSYQSRLRPRSEHLGHGKRLQRGLLGDLHRQSYEEIRHSAAESNYPHEMQLSRHRGGGHQFDEEPRAGRDEQGLRQPER